VHKLTAEMIVRDQAGNTVMGSDGEPWRIVFAGPDHQKASRLSPRQQRRMLARMMAGRDDAMEAQIAPLVKRTLAWSPVELEGKPFPCTPENARRLFSRSVTIRRQAERFLVSEGSFALLH